VCSQAVEPLVSILLFTLGQKPIDTRLQRFIRHARDARKILRR